MLENIPWEILLTVVLVYNLIVFIIYGIDKKLAQKHKRRVSEKTLLLLAAGFGSIGAFMAMQFFRHKTKHWKFKILVPLFLILQLGIAYFSLYSWLEFYIKS